MEVGNRIREERGRQGLSQEDLARRIFVSRQTVSNWETGRTYPDVQSLLLLSSLFDVSIDSLVKGDEVQMDREIEHEVRRMRRLGNGMAVLLAVAIAGAAYFAVAGADVAMAVWLVVFWAAAMACAIAVEKMKRAHKLATYRQLKAFMEGRSPEEAEDDAGRLPRWAKTVLSAGGAAVMGMVLALACISAWSLLAAGLR